MKRVYIKPQPIEVKPTFISGGRYVTLTDYARREGITRMTAYNLIKKGAVSGSVRVGGRAVLIRV